ncbi:MAG: DNRLRE domain-containing protein, partial [Candidatus Thorarchaeota archaeon]
MKARRLFTLGFILLFCFSIFVPVFDGRTTQDEILTVSTALELQHEYDVSDGETEYIIIRVQDDEAVVSESPDVNFNDTTDAGGLAVGMSPTGGPVRSWLKFNFSDVPDEVSFVGASLWTYLNIEMTTNDAPFAVHYSLDNSWSESTITWNNQPAFSVSSLDVISSPASPEMLVNGSWYEWDVTSGVSAAMAGGNYLSLILKEDTEPGGSVSMKFFTEKEYYGFNASYLALEYIVPATGNTTIDDGTPSPVPEYIQHDTPAFTWEMIDSDPNDFQRGYEIQVWDNSDYNDTLLWNENTNHIVTLSSNGDIDSIHPFGALSGMRVQMKIPSTMIPESGIVDKLIFQAANPGH